MLRNVCALQCTVVEKACVKFLTSLDLDASSLAVLMRLWERINNVSHSDVFCMLNLGTPCF